MSAQLVELRAIEFQNFMTSGGTSPAVFICEDEAGRMAEYVVKFRSRALGKEVSILFEAMASKLAHHFGLRTPEPALVRLDETLARALDFNPAAQGLVFENIGINFCSRFMPGYFPWPKDKATPHVLRRAATMILAFDALIDNDDRSTGSENLLSKSS